MAIAQHGFEPLPTEVRLELRLDAAGSTDHLPLQNIRRKHVR